MPQAVHTGGGFVHLVTTMPLASAMSTTTVMSTAVAARAATVALRLAFASKRTVKYKGMGHVKIFVEFEENMLKKKRGS